MCDHLHHPIINPSSHPAMATLLSERTCFALRPDCSALLFLSTFPPTSQIWGSLKILNTLTLPFFSSTFSFFFTLVPSLVLSSTSLLNIQFLLFSLPLLTSRSLSLSLSLLLSLHSPSDLFKPPIHSLHSPFLIPTNCPTLFFSFLHSLLLSGPPSSSLHKDRKPPLTQLFTRVPNVGPYRWTTLSFLGQDPGRGGALDEASSFQ